jgi:hypothetical protein
MKSLPAFVLLVAIGLAGDHMPAQSTRNAIQGAWQVAEMRIPGQTPRTITVPEPKPNLVLFTAKYYSRVEVQAESPRPILANPATATADELRATWGPFVGEAGTYEATADTITMRPIASKNPAVMGSGVFIVYQYKVEDGTLLITQQRNQAGPFANPFTLKLVRIE